MWPHWTDEAELLAKSEDFGGDTLADHTWAVLTRLRDQVRLRPQLVDVLGERVWQRMFWGCLLHDFGKAASGFQQVLRKQDSLWGEYRQRHEILSLAFVDWLFPRQHIDRNWIIATIAFHHKDSTTIFEKYGGIAPYRPDMEDYLYFLDHLSTQISDETRRLLWRWLDECSLAWADELGIPQIDPPELLPLDAALKTDLGKSMRLALRDFAEWQKQLKGDLRTAASLYRGLILTADHAASAGAGEFPPMPLTEAIAEKPLEHKNPRSHQDQAKAAPPGSAIMIAPTGSGKTEAAMRWAARQMQYRPAARLFYTLPYQASMNAMVARLLKAYFSEDPANPLQLADDANQFVSIQHSRARLKFYQDMMEADSDPHAAADAARWMQNRTRLNYFPIQVFSPYQMLKAAYQLKGYEALLVDYTDALFIFDEIHAYEPRRMALIITMIQWLRQHFRARFLVMTATLPPMVRDQLCAALDIGWDSEQGDVIRASPELFKQSQRHQVTLLDGALLDQIESRIEQVWAQDAPKKILICCNQVAHAQEVYQRLKENPALRLQADEIILLHSRFNGKDRSEKEQMVLDMAGVGKAARRFITVATQVVEVSLDVDFDVLYTDPAPLEALLQRFGRVNRGRKQIDPDHPHLETVYVFRTVPGGDEDDTAYRPYDAAVVRRSLDVLESFCRDNPAIDESQVNEMLTQIYQGDIRARWEAEYQRKAKEFQSVILGAMTPFVSADQDMKLRFYQMFEGRQVLPEACEEDYEQAVKNGGFLAGSEYLVSINIPGWRYKRLCDQKMIEEKNDYIDITYLNYDPEWGLSFEDSEA